MLTSHNIIISNKFISSAFFALKANIYVPAPVLVPYSIIMMLGPNPLVDHHSCSLVEYLCVLYNVCILGPLYNVCILLLLQLLLLYV